MPCVEDVFDWSLPKCAPCSNFKQFQHELRTSYVYRQFLYVVFLLLPFIYLLMRETTTAGKEFLVLVTEAESDIVLNMNVGSSWTVWSSDVTLVVALATLKAHTCVSEMHFAHIFSVLQKMLLKGLLLTEY